MCTNTTSCQTGLDGRKRSAISVVPASQQPRTSGAAHFPLLPVVSLQPLMSPPRSATVFMCFCSHQISKAFGCRIKKENRNMNVPVNSSGLKCGNVNILALNVFKGLMAMIRMIRRGT